jgi:hypothetical protein
MAPAAAAAAAAAASNYCSEEAHALLLLPLALEGHALDALGVVNKAQLLVQPNNLRCNTEERAYGTRVQPLPPSKSPNVLMS